MDYDKAAWMYEEIKKQSEMADSFTRQELLQAIVILGDELRLIQETNIRLGNACLLFKSF